MNPAFNPQPTYLACPDQLDIFIFQTRTGFAGIEFTDIQGFMADADDPSLASSGSRVFVKSQDVCYPAVESVPDLVARYADMKRRRDEALFLAQQPKLPANVSTWKK